MPRFFRASQRLREAYELAHEVRRFEIELYWRRSAYFWTLQAAAFAGAAVIASTYSTITFGAFLNKIVYPESYAQSQNLLILAASIIGLFGLTSAYCWRKSIQGSKFWQKNWEAHVDALEEEFSGNLYKTYPDWTERPVSVSQVNYFMATCSLAFWVLFVLGAPMVLWPAELSAFFKTDRGLIAAVLGIGASAILIPLLDSFLRMDASVREIGKFGRKGDGKPYVLAKRAGPEGGKRDVPK